MPYRIPPIDQAAVVAYRWRNGAPEFCLITSAGKRHWGLPKGIIDPGETSQQTALKEAEEEAGIAGRIEGSPLGTYQYRKWGTVLEVTVYLMRVTCARQRWEEGSFRTRIWCGAEEAESLIYRDEQRRMIRLAMGRIAP